MPQIPQFPYSNPSFAMAQYRPSFPEPPLNYTLPADLHGMPPQPPLLLPPNLPTPLTRIPINFRLAMRDQLMTVVGSMTANLHLRGYPATAQEVAQWMGIELLYTHQFN